jgi:hypothetical protein
MRPPKTAVRETNVFSLCSLFSCDAEVSDGLAPHPRSCIFSRPWSQPKYNIKGKKKIEATEVLNRNLMNPDA